MTTVLAVHGIAQRAPEELGRLRRLSEVVTAADPQATMLWCDWGESCGARMLAGGASLPKQPGPRAQPDDLWAELDQDPLFELRLLAARAHVGRRAPHHPAVGQALANRLAALSSTDALTTDAELAAVAAVAGLSNVISSAVTVVLDAEPARVALAGAAEPAGELREALARATVAVAMARAGTPGLSLPLDGHTAGAVVDAITARLGGPSELGPLRWLRGLAVARAAKWARRHQQELALGGTPYVGDVVKYLANGDGLRAQIRAALAAAEPPVIVVGHSLGGVACVDVLAEADAPPVQALITVGSQAPYLYEIDAMPRLRFGDQLRHNFPRWINVLDNADLLAFAAARLFAGHAADRVVDNGAPFPRAHWAYFDNYEFHTLIAEVLA
jgi:hypothetical protein